MIPVYSVDVGSLKFSLHLFRPNQYLRHFPFQVLCNLSHSSPDQAPSHLFFNAHTTNDDIASKGEKVTRHKIPLQSEGRVNGTLKGPPSRDDNIYSKPNPSPLVFFAELTPI